MKENNTLMQKFIENKFKSQYISAINDEIQGMVQNKISHETTASLFQILKYVGFLSMKGILLDNQLQSKIAMLIQNCTDTGEYFILENYIELINEYIEKYNTFSDMSLPAIGQENENLNKWEMLRSKLFELCMTFINAGVDIIAIREAYFFLRKNNTNIHKSFQISWNKFNAMSEDFFKQLYGLKKNLFSFSDYLFKVLVNFPDIPDTSFRSFIIDICSPRITYPKEQHFQTILVNDEYTDIYCDVMETFTECTPTRQTVLYEHALAENLINKFFWKMCQSLLSEIDISEYEIFNSLSSNLSENNDCQGAYIKINETIYSIHMIYPGLTSWLIRKDIIMNFPEELYNGGIFCSWKIYNDNQILIRFDNFIQKNRLFQLINDSKSYENDKIIKIHNKDVYSKDSKMEFLIQSTKQLIQEYISEGLLMSLLIKIMLSEKMKGLALSDITIITTKPWVPILAGQRVTAADISEQEHVFPLENIDIISIENGAIKVISSWKPKYKNYLSFVTLSWETNVNIMCDYWACFINPNTNEIYSTICLGGARVGSIKIESDELGFDPSTEKWSISIVLAES